MARTQPFNNNLASIDVFFSSAIIMPRKTGSFGREIQYSARSIGNLLAVHKNYRYKSVAVTFSAHLRWQNNCTFTGIENLFLLFRFICRGCRILLICYIFHIIALVASI